MDPHKAAEIFCVRVRIYLALLLVWNKFLSNSKQDTHEELSLERPRLNDGIAFDDSSTILLVDSVLFVFINLEVWTQNLVCKERDHLRK